MPPKPPPCRSSHLGIIGGAEAAFWRLAWIIFAPRRTCMNFRSSAEGREGSGPAHIPMVLRVIWTGVSMSAQGNPEAAHTGAVNRSACRRLMGEFNRHPGQCRSPARTGIRAL